MTRTVSREDLSRTLLMYGAFTSSAVILEGDDERTLVHLRRLRAALNDERGDAVARVIRGLERLMGGGRTDLTRECANAPAPPEVGEKLYQT